MWSSLMNFLLDDRGGAAAVVFFLFPSLENETIPLVHVEQLSAEEHEKTFHQEVQEKMMFHYQARLGLNAYSPVS